MTQDEIIEMVRIAENKVIENPNLDWKIEFAKLVAAKEREACAKVCEDLDAHRQVATWYSQAIRARAQADRGEA